MVPMWFEEVGKAYLVATFVPNPRCYGVPRMSRLVCDHGRLRPSAPSEIDPECQRDFPPAPRGMSLFPARDLDLPATLTVWSRDARHKAVEPSSYDSLRNAFSTAFASTDRFVLNAWIETSSGILLGPGALRSIAETWAGPLDRPAGSIPMRPHACGI